MDNTKTGALIKQARKEKGLTQRELAEALHITDRAVSKWERGICAPDIALLEPLGEILGLSITELITGQRNPVESPVEQTEAAVKEAIRYSATELRRKSKVTKMLLLSIAAALLLAAALSLGLMWHKGIFHIIGRYPSPDGTTLTTVYDCVLSYGDAPEKGGFTLGDEGYYRGRTTYRNAEFRGLWWSPDGKYQVVSIYAEGDNWFGDGETILFLADYTRNVGSNLDLDLDRALYKNEFFADVPEDEEWAREDIEFEFVQWSQADPAKMLVYFSYTDIQGAFREGYMWYDYESGKSSGEMELEQGEKDTDPLHEFWEQVS